MSVFNRGISDRTLIDRLGPRLEFEKGLAEYTSFKTGGTARYFFSAQTTEDITRAVRAAGELEIPYFFLGGGSNILVSDQGFDGLIIKIDIHGLKLVDPDKIESGAGEQLSALVDFATQNSLSGLEFAAGIWGTVGGAICGNAGAFGGDIGTLVTEVTLVDTNGQVKDIDPQFCQFSYRHSNLKSGDKAIIKAGFKMIPGNKDEISKKVDEILNLRRGKHPVNGCSAGCFFKNIVDPDQENGKLPAGKLLEEVGAKNMSIGGARVFEKHANIIVNSGTATSRDIRMLADLLKEKVYRQFGVRLEEEVIQLGKF